MYCPLLLRLNLRDPTPTESVDALEATLRDFGHHDAALELLAEHGLWERFLHLLTEAKLLFLPKRALEPQINI